MADVDTANWSGDGAFTQLLIERLQQVDRVAFLRVEDAPATRAEANYNFISNEIFVGFATEGRTEHVLRFGFIPLARKVVTKSMTVGDLERILASLPDIGQPDYADETMLQYLKTERVVPPYQTRGYKLIELVRIYEAGTVPGE
jgi:hypothetical protein